MPCWRSAFGCAVSVAITVAVRVIAATNSPLEESVESGSFRRDLFHRLNVYSIHLTPLRERHEDILPLAEHFLGRYAVPRGLPPEGFSTGARDKLLGYDFPTNARELRYLAERAAILCRSSLILRGTSACRKQAPLPQRPNPRRPRPLRIKSAPAL